MLTDRQKRLDMLSHEVYGESPKVYGPTQVRVVEEVPKCCAGHAVLKHMEVTAQTEKGPFTFPIHVFMPTAAGKHPLFVLINFRPDVYDMYYPAEEIIDRGFALAVVHYEYLTSDDGNMQNGLAGCFTRPADGTGFGKIGLWAWGASRVLDAMLTFPEIDAEHVAVIGHSRLGKTALWCAAQDERFRYAFSNDSGCAGAALEKTKHEGAETVEVITRVFPFWFCENYFKYAGKPETMPFDQHDLLAAIAPRCVMVGSASLDLWADPYSEQLCCAAASPAWEKQGLTGFVGPDTPAAIGDRYLSGNVGYQLRDGIHFLSRNDWLAYMDFIDLHK